MQFRLAIVLVAVLASGPALAQPRPASPSPGWYGGIDASRSRLGLEARNVELGYRFSPSFRLEGRYLDPGRSSYAPSLGFSGDRWRERGFALSGTGTWRFGEHWSLYGRASLGSARDELDPGGFVGPGFRMRSDPGTGIMVGAGATYEFSRRLYGRLGWSRYLRAGDDPARPGDFNFYSFGVGVRF